MGPSPKALGVARGKGCGLSVFHEDRDPPTRLPVAENRHQRRLQRAPLCWVLPPRPESRSGSAVPVTDAAAMMRWGGHATDTGLRAAQRGAPPKSTARHFSKSPHLKQSAFNYQSLGASNLM